MSSVVSSAASPTVSACVGQNFGKYPTNDVFCAFDGRQGISKKSRDEFKKCCKDAPVDEWANGCALYCLAAGQNVNTLFNCFEKTGIESEFLFCNGSSDATATATGDLSTLRPTGTRATSSTGTAEAQESSGAAVPATVPHVVSKTGIFMTAIIAVSAFAGALL